MNDAPTIHELRSMAEEAMRETAPVARKGISRAARLSLIDQLSRWGISGLATLFGATIFIAVAMTRGQPLKAGVWAALVFAAFYLCRRYRKEFRRGDKIASHPFRWRAHYTSALAVMSAAFGAGALMLLPAGTPRATMEIAFVMIFAAAIASAFHAAHLRAAAAAGIPAFIGVAAAGIEAFGVSPNALFILSAGLLSASAIAFAGAEVAARATARFPRTSIVRREIGRKTGAPAISAARAAAN